jgi:hypothetical protein
MRRSHRNIRDEQLIDEYLEQLPRQPASTGSLPSPSFIWWKAQLLRRMDAEREATVLIDVGDAVHVILAILGAVALGIGGWSTLPNTSSPVVAAAIGLGGVLLVTVLALAMIDALRNR